MVNIPAKLLLKNRALVLLWISCLANSSSGFVPLAARNSKVSKRAISPISSQSQPDIEISPGVDNETRTSIAAKLEAELGGDIHNDNDQRRMHMFNRRLKTIRLDRTVVKPSTLVEGQRGLFAGCDCRKGDLLTCYPGDLLIVIPDEGDYIIRTGGHVNNNMNGHSFDDDDYDLSDELVGYLLHTTDDYGVLGLPWLDQDSAYLGHFANDGAANPTQAQDVDAYIRESLDKANAKNEMISCHMVTVATRDIPKGEEIFTSYGPDYWMDNSDYED